MARPINDLSGQRFGALVALALSTEVNHNRTRLWVCRCDCGRLVTRASTKLSSNEIRSCGCMEHVRNARTGVGVSGFNSLWQKYFGAAKKRNLSFDLTKDEFKILTSNNCYYCGIPPYRAHVGSVNGKREYGKYIFNGIDRVDNTKGYELDNVVACCRSCNLAKHTQTKEEFLDLITRIYKNRIDKEDG